ncbi:hypothetical protein HanPSC8_Chr15g0645781 [Helianthus annuus]|nr:hypothetical protein HanPSC8_Chr15g0645781 [Helianthus annuus]
MIIVSISPYTFQQNASNIARPSTGNNSTSDKVMYRQGTESLQPKCTGGLLTLYVPFIFLYSMFDTTTADVWFKHRFLGQ